ncbi:Hypothetical Protein FCC1311_023642 [Hondaea fermentalgiana]|uniref:Uncharacterized protein n=1 Tax=Hondaea fermentalgiana TaxID=2315210 RepID=A0A2R5GEA5_9STRA|nr:Hypothetical Protein FCC1311_023642 [Hondaea fermentalgiana]|eukprot:GBG26144.1 Hypothetical Protein FCC1311_023642 [Hondaea fermentalgiana]
MAVALHGQYIVPWVQKAVQNLQSCGAFSELEADDQDRCQRDDREDHAAPCKRPTLTRQSTIIGINISQFNDLAAQSRPSQLSCKDIKSPLPRSLVVASNNATSPSSLLLAPKSEEPSLISELRQFYLGSKEERVQRAASLTEEEKAEYELINSDQMLLQRESIRFSARIRSLLTMVWLAADSDFSGKLDKPEYMLLNQKLQVAVIGQFDPVEGAAMAEEDWEIDSSGLDHLNFASFSHSWFQIVDLWTDEVNEDVYFAFLNQLVQRMLIVGENGTLRFRENDDIVSQEEYEELKAQGRWQGIEVAANPLEARRRHCPPDREKLAVARRKKLLQEKKKAAMARALVIARFSLSDKAKAQSDSLYETRTSKASDKPFQDDIENFDCATAQGHRKLSAPVQSADEAISKTDVDDDEEHEQPPMCGLVTQHDLQINAGLLGELPEKHSQRRDVETLDKNPVPIVYMRKVTRNRPYKHEGLSVFAPRKQAQVLEMAHRLGEVKDEGPSGGHAAVAHAATKCKFTAIRDWLEAPCGKPWQAMQDSEIHFGTASAGLL